MSKIQFNTDNLNSMISHLMLRINSLEETLLLLKSNDINDLSKMTLKLEVLDKAKLYITLSYSIYSLIFMNFKLNRVNMKDHLLMKELERVEHYVNKIKEAEISISRRTLVLDKQTVDRIITHDLSGNSISDIKKKNESIQNTNTPETPLKKGIHIRFEPLSAKSSTLNNESLQTDTTETQNTEMTTSMNKKRSENAEELSSIGLYKNVRFEI
ncbi:hypothetical protein PCANB_002224 [Pneumocystis canis]|nr:hypothetical protein PCANB_002224 [Pneumocystis canis]